jgi:hypothetical protein
MLFAASAPRPPIQGHFRSPEQVSIFEYSSADSGPHRHAFVSAARLEIRALPGGLFTGTGFQHRLTGFAMLL